MARTEIATTPGRHRINYGRSVARYRSETCRTHSTSLSEGASLAHQRAAAGECQLGRDRQYTGVAETGHTPASVMTVNVS